MHSGEDNDPNEELYIQDSSDEDVRPADRALFSNRMAQHTRRTIGRQKKLLQNDRHLIKQEATPSSTGRPLQGIGHLLARPSKSSAEQIDDSDSESERPAASLKKQPESWRNCPELHQYDRPASRARDSIDPVEDTAEPADDLLRTPQHTLRTGWTAPAYLHGPQSSADKGVEPFKRQRLGEGAPLPEPNADMPAEGVSGHRNFLASHLHNLGNVPSSAIRTTPKKGEPLKMQLTAEKGQTPWPLKAQLI